MSLRKLQNKAKKDDEERLPGVAQSRPDKAIKTVNVLEGRDNARDQLHPSRFSLRPCMDPPSVWFPKNMPVKRPDRPRNPNVTHLGAAQQVHLH